MEVKLTEHFNLTEFGCKDGTQVPFNLQDNVKELAENLQALRDEIKVPIFINSGYRSAEYNKKVGGVSNSFHLKAMAADITTKNFSPTHLAKIIEVLIEKKKMKQGGIGVYPGFVHYDIRGFKARW